MNDLMTVIGSIKGTVIWTGVLVWFAHGWYLNDRLASVHEKLDRVSEQLEGLRQYLYEIDPQFDDERRAQKSTEADTVDQLVDIIHQKEATGRRTLYSPFNK